MLGASNAIGGAFGANGAGTSLIGAAGKFLNGGSGGSTGGGSTGGGYNLGAAPGGDVSGGGGIREKAVEVIVAADERGGVLAHVCSFACRNHCSISVSARAPTLL